MAVSDVIAQDGGQGNVKLHPYLVTLVRWCVSCLWSTATVLLHRLMTTPLPPIAASSKPAKLVGKPRQAGTDHLHPEPRVECVILHTPAVPDLDVIFVHGLYGSLGNTWRQGEWRSKYKLDPTKVPLRNHAKTCKCTQSQPENIYNNIQQIYPYETNINEKVISNCYQKILPNENSLITEKFYKNTLIPMDVNSYETQAKFVTELFKNDCDNKICDYKMNTFKCKDDVNSSKCKTGDCNCKFNECKCKLDVKLNENRCEVGCGCTCDECYSTCWPKDWIKEDFPGARVISINYTSDPYLWRPLWVKGNKRLRLHERAEQMMDQLLKLGVGQRPIVWVGHSKGGLFIKQIYCEAYEAYLQKNNKVCVKQNVKNNNSEDQSHRQYNNVNNNIDNKYTNIDNNGRRNNLLSNFINEQHGGCAKNGETALRSIDDMNEIRNNYNSGNFNEDNIDYDNNYNIDHESGEVFGCTEKDDVLNNKIKEYIDMSVRDNEQISNIEDEVVEAKNEVDFEVLSSNLEEDREMLSLKSSLWTASSGFMFYSVPHKGSPLADIKTPITSRSIELQEIAKDCPLVIDLHDRWMAATKLSRPVVRSLVETCKTLMSVLWLRIVSEDSADAGVGSLHGVSVDHREICKPSSRNCLLYTELTDLIKGALSKCDCQ